MDTVVSLTGFALVGGPARQDAPKAVEALKKLNVPYLVSLPLVFQTTEEWSESELGLHPVQVALQVWAQAGSQNCRVRGWRPRAGRPNVLSARLVAVLHVVFLGFPAACPCRL